MTKKRTSVKVNRFILWRCVEEEPLEVVTKGTIEVVVKYLDELVASGNAEYDFFITSVMLNKRQLQEGRKRAH